MKTWENIWSNRTNEVRSYTLEELLKINGYDQAQSRLTSETITNFCRDLEKLSEMKPGESVYEVGCGSGATLKYFYDNGYTVGGCDLSTNLVEVAKENLKGEFSQSNANEIICTGGWDHVISFGTFFYFPDLDYAGDTLIRMLIKAKKSVSVLDIPDFAKIKQSEERRRELIGPEYDDKYKDLQHLYYPKEWWQGVGDSLGIKTAIYDQAIPGYENSAFRYNVTYIL
jgi:SAM-dependent methyltransferase